MTDPSQDEFQESDPWQRAALLLAGTDLGFEDVAKNCGLDPNSFAHGFQTRFLLNPDAYRHLGNARRFRIHLPEWLPLTHLKRYWGRDPSSLSEKVDEHKFSWCTVTPVGPIRIDATFEGEISWSTTSSTGQSRPEPELRDESLGPLVHQMLMRSLGLHLDPRPFEQRSFQLGHESLIHEHIGQTLPQTGSVFDGALWVVAGQQVSLAAAFSIRRRLTEALGRPIDGMICSPAPVDVAASDPETLHGCGLTRRKAEYLHGIALMAQETTSPFLPHAPVEPSLEHWRRLSLEDSEKLLMDIRGYGAWSTGYMLMRALGFADAVPLGDVALQKALQLYFGLEKRPDRQETEKLMEPFRPYRSLATFHFWSWVAARKK